MNNSLSLEYTAGLFDGEGWFSISESGGKRKDGRKVFQLYAALALRQKEVVDLLKEVYGGSVQRHKPRNKSHNVSWRWVSTGRKARDFAILVLPYLKVKHRQARLAIKFEDSKWESGLYFNSDQLDFQLLCRDTMNVLNERGVND